MSPAVPLYRKLFPPVSLPQVFSAHKYKYARKPLAGIQRRHALRARFLSPFPAKAMPDRLFRPHAAVPFSPADGTSAPGPVFGYRKASPPAFPRRQPFGKHPCRKESSVKPFLPSAVRCRTLAAAPLPGKQNPAAARGKKKSPLRKERAADPAQGAPNAAENIPGFAEKCSPFRGKPPRPHRKAPLSRRGRTYDLAETPARRGALPRRNMLLCRRRFSSAEEAPQAPQGNQRTLPRRAPPKIPLTGSPTSPKCRAAPRSRQS